MKSKRNDSELLARAYRIRELRSFLGLSREKFIEFFNSHKQITFASLENWELIRWNGLTWSGAKKLAHALQQEKIPVTAEWLYYGRGENPLLQMEKPVEQARFKSSDADRFQQEWRLFSQLHPKAILHQIEDDSLAPFLQIGDYVAGEQLTGKDMDQGISQLCIAELKPKEFKVYFINGGIDYHLYTLSSCSGESAGFQVVQQDVELISLAPIIWIRKA